MISSKKRKYLIIVNPAAGSFNEALLIDSLNDSIGKQHYKLHYVKKKDDIGTVSRKSSDTFETIVAAGGDGTVNLVGNGLIGTTAFFGIIPLGTANIFAKELHIPLELPDAVSLLKQRKTILKVDAMKLNERYYFQDISVGIKSVTVKNTHSSLKRVLGMWAYIWTGIKWLINWQPRRFRLEVDNSIIFKRAAEVTIANAGTFGITQLRYGSGIRMDDGVINVCIMKQVSFIHLLQALWHFFRRTNQMPPNIEYANAVRKVVVSTSKPLPVQADGELVGMTPIKVEILRSALHVICAA